MDIVVQGGQRFYIDQMDDSRAYLMSGIFYIDDMEESVSDEDEVLLHKTTELLTRFNELSGRTGDDDRFNGMDLQRLSFIIPSAEGFTLKERQQFLEMTSAHERIQKGLKVLEKVIARVKINREVIDIIGGNGHVREFLADKGLVV
jgi:ATP-dependent Lon protease